MQVVCTARSHLPSPSSVESSLRGVGAPAPSPETGWHHVSLPAPPPPPRPHVDLSQQAPKAAAAHGHTCSLPDFSQITNDRTGLPTVHPRGGEWAARPCPWRRSCRGRRSQVVMPATEGGAGRWI